MAIKKSALYSSLWQSCDELRGGMDASLYKDYILTLLFVKYVSDKYANQDDALLVIPEGGAFADMMKLRGDKEIGDKINKIIGKLAEENDLKGVIDLADFNDEEKLGKGKEMQDRLSKLLAIFNDLDFGRNRAEGDDLLGDAYEYLMRNFATESGKSKGQFYTPAEVSIVLSKVLGISSETPKSASVYDPTCGSGSLLLKAADEAPNGLSIFGQEKDVATTALAKMNMFLHDSPLADIAAGGSSTLSDPAFVEGPGELSTFDFVVANPPFSLKAWGSGFIPESDEFKRFEYGVPPGKNGDYAFLLHILRSLKSTGRGAVILPHGVLFRGNAEGIIRKEIIKRGYIKGIIGLPANLFYGTGIPACIIVLDKEHAESRKGIFMVDASDGFIKDGNKNRLRSQDIHKIVDVFTKQLEIEGYSRMVPMSEISGDKNDYNLNLPRYIDNTDAEDIHDLEAHLRGGIPARDVDALDDYWKVFTSTREALFEPSDRDGYLNARVSSDQVKSTILGSAEYSSYADQILNVLAGWRDEQEDYLKGLAKGVRPKDVIFKISESLLEKFSGQPLLDKYDIYQHLMTYWRDVMQDDVYQIAQVDWVEAAKVVQIVEDKSKKVKETPDIVIGSGKNAQKFKTDLIPPHLIVAKYFAAEKEALDELKDKLEKVVKEIENFEEERSGDEDLLDGLKEAGKKISKTDLEQRIVEYVDIAYKVLIPEQNNALSKLKVAVTKSEREFDHFVSHSKNEPLLARCRNKKNTITKGAVKSRIAEASSDEEVSILQEYLRVLDNRAGNRKSLKTLRGEMDELLFSMIANGSQEPEAKDVDDLISFQRMLESEAVFTKQIKEAQTELDKKTIGLYPKLSEQEIKGLVVNDKWFASIENDVVAEIEDTTQYLSNRVRTLEERYYNPLPNITEEVEALTKRVENHLRNMGVF